MIHSSDTFFIVVAGKNSPKIEFSFITLSGMENRKITMVNIDKKKYVVV